MRRISRPLTAGEFSRFGNPGISKSLILSKCCKRQACDPKPLKVPTRKCLLRDALVPLPQVFINLQSALHWDFRTCTASKLDTKTLLDARHLKRRLRSSSRRLERRASTTSTRIPASIESSTRHLNLFCLRYPGWCMETSRHETIHATPHCCKVSNTRR